MKTTVFAVSLTFLMGGSLVGSPAHATEPQVAEGAAERCVSGPMAGFRVIPQTRDVTLGPITWHDQYNQTTQRYENVGRGISWEVKIPETNWRVGVRYNDLNVNGVCLGYRNEVDKFAEGLE